MQDKSPELELAIRAALEAGKILERYFETEILQELKEDNTPVTLADRESEEMIKKIIWESFPEHSILGEETGLTENNAEYVWHIDPIDGTRNFANGLPIFCVSIAFVHNNSVIVAVIYNPITRSLFCAERGKGAYLNEKQIFVSKDDRKHAIFTVDPGNTEEDKKFRKELQYNLAGTFIRSIRDLGSAAIELAYVARGGLEVNIELGLHTYDFAAGTLLVEEAGGTITTLDGSPWKFPENRFVASNGVFHDMLIEEIKRQKAKLDIQ